MRAFVSSAVSIVLVSILFCPVVMSAPPMPADLQIVQPDPSLPKELSAFFGKWEGSSSGTEYFLIVEKIDPEKGTLYFWRGGSVTEVRIPGWERIESNVVKEQGKYKLWWRDRVYGYAEIILKGESLDMSSSRTGGPRLRRVP